MCNSNRFVIDIQRVVSSRVARLQNSSMHNIYTVHMNYTLHECMLSCVSTISDTSMNDCAKRAINNFQKDKKDYDSIIGVWSGVVCCSPHSVLKIY